MPSRHLKSGEAPLPVLPPGAQTNTFSRLRGPLHLQLSIKFYGASQCLTLPRQVLVFLLFFRSCDLFVCLLLFSYTVFYDLTTYLALQ